MASSSAIAGAFSKEAGERTVAVLKKIRSRLDPALPKSPEELAAASRRNESAFMGMMQKLGAARG